MKWRTLSMTVAMAITTLFLLTPAAWASPPLETMPGETTVTVPANGEVTVDVNAFCLNAEEPFPGVVQWSSERAADDVVKVLKAAASDGTGASNVLQTQIAVWHAVEGQWTYKDEDVDMTVAQALADTAAGLTTEPLLGRGLALDEAVAAGKVEVTVKDWAQADAPKALPADLPYYGTGTLVIKNLTAEPLDVYVPLGVVLKAANEAEQDMGVYAVTQQVKEVPKSLPATGGSEPTLLFLVGAGILSLLGGLALSRRPVRA